MDVEIQPARRHIRQACYPAGLRLLKLPEQWPKHGPAHGWLSGRVWDERTRSWVERGVVDNLARWREENRVDRRGRGEPPYSLKQGNLARAQYAFWRGSKFPDVMLSQCRWCCLSCYSEKERMAHQRQVDGDYTHAKLVQFCAKLLLERGECAMCAVQTKHSKWGVPLCAQQRCLDQFMFDAPLLSRQWAEAVRFIRADLAQPEGARIILP